MSRSVAAALVLSALCAGGAIGCYARAQRLHSDAQWLMARGNAAAAEYASTFDGAMADRQLSSFDRRRQILEDAILWQRGQMLFILCSVVSAFASYIFFLFRRLREQLVDATAPLEGEPVELTTPLAGTSQLH